MPTPSTHGLQDGQQVPVSRPVSRFKAIAQSRCPQCREGRMFPHSAVNLARFAKMHNACPNCEQDFRIEPGFYFGAAYISYAINIALIVIGVILYFTFFSEYSEWYAIGGVILVNVLLVPFNYRYSRTLMLHFFGGVKFRGKGT